VTAAVDGAGVVAGVVGAAAGAAAAPTATSFEESEGEMAPVVAGVAAGEEVAALDGGKYVVVPLDEFSTAGSSARAAGMMPAEQTPNKLTPRRRSAKSLIIPRLAPIGERRVDASIADIT
jgi:hypothetical protein